MKKSSVLPRLALFFVLLISVFVLPFWVNVLLLLYGFVRFSFFVEGIIAGFCFDLLYHAAWLLPSADSGGNAAQGFFLAFSATLVSLLLLVAIENLKQYLFLGERGR